MNMGNTWFRLIIRGWLAITSLVVFIIGWAFLGHSPKPAGNNVVANEPVPQLTPLPTLAFPAELDNGSSINLLPQQSPSIQFAMPQFRTRGS
jgi:hypothetical protein